MNKLIGKKGLNEQRLKIVPKQKKIQAQQTKNRKKHVLKEETKMPSEINEKNEFKLDIVSIRLAEDTPLYSTVPISSPDVAVDLLGKEMCSYDREIVYVLNLTSKGQVINANLASMGSINNSIVTPREIFKSAILSNSASIILLHNHPSGDPSPSSEDYTVTQRIGECGELLGIRMLDHIIIGSEGQYYSFCEHKELPYQSKEK